MSTTEHNTFPHGRWTAPRTLKPRVRKTITQLRLCNYRAQMRAAAMEYRQNLLPCKYESAAHRAERAEVYFGIAVAYRNMALELERQLLEREAA